MQKFLYKLKIIFSDSTLRKRLLFVVGALFIFRFFSAIPIPGVNTGALASFLSDNQLFGLLNVFSGGGLSRVSIAMIGVGPYITASIILQLLTIMVPRLKALYQEEGDAGRKKFAQYSRLLTVPLAAFSAFGFLTILTRQGVLAQLPFVDMLANIAVVTAGSLVVMWIGELISEFGIGNGVSLLIFAGIVAALPTEVSQFVFAFDMAQLPVYLLFLVIGLVIVAGVVVITEAERPIPVTYAKQMRGNKMYGGGSSYLPLRLNQAGVMPIIFALSLLLFPQIIANVLSGAANPALAKVAVLMTQFLQNTVLYAVAYFVLVVLFTYFYTAVTFDPTQIATNLQKNGAFVPGIRPGQSTIDYLGKVVTRITLVGALALGLIAVLPLIIRSITGITALAIGGTALMIAVSVVLDLVKKLDAQVSMREY